MEKIKFLSTLVFLGTVVLGQTACSSSEDVANGTTESSEPQYIAVNITNVGNPGTRASYQNGDGTYEDGLDAENKITSARFYFFTSTGEPYRLNNSQNNVNYLDVNIDDTQSSGPNHDQTIEKTTQAVIVIEGVNGTVPRSMMAIVNPSTAVTNALGTGSLSQAQLENASLHRIAQGHTGDGADAKNFVMTSSTYDNDGATMMAATTNGHIATSREAALAAPVDIYVERLDAKVRTNISSNAAWQTITYYTDADGNVVKSTDAGATSHKGNIMQVGTTDNSVPVYALVKGWGIADEQPQVSLLKDFSNKNLWGNYTVTDNGLGFVWNIAAFHRSYWEGTMTFNEDNKIQNHSFNYYANNAMGTYLYTNPNTRSTSEGYYIASRNPAASYLSKVVIAAQLVQYVDGEYLPIEVCSYKSLQYVGVDNVKTAVLTDLQNYCVGTTTTSGTTYADLTKDDVDFAHPSSVTEIRAYHVVPQVRALEDGEAYYIKNSDGTYTATTRDAINTMLATSTYRAEIRKNGFSYYYTPIRHLANAKVATPAQDSDYPIGYYGVVRNHIYDVSINSITGFGTPVYDPDVVFDPVTPTNSASYIAARINVLSWRVVTSSVDINGSIITQ